MCGKKFGARDRGTKSRTVTELSAHIPRSPAASSKVSPASDCASDGCTILPGFFASCRVHRVFAILSSILAKEASVLPLEVVTRFIVC